MNKAGVFVLENTTQSVHLEFEKDAKPGVVEIKDLSVDPNEHADFVTGAVVVWLTVQGLKVLSSWLNKHSKKRTVTITGTVQSPDGTKRTTTVKWTSKESEAAEQEQLEALAKQLDVDFSTLPG
jgi:hypothetical protein